MEPSKEIQAIEWRTGEVDTVLVDQTETVYWRKSMLTSKGKIDRRKPGSNGRSFGRVLAKLDPERDKQGDEIRLRIELIYADLQTARNTLAKLYGEIAY